jgi:hypothetical protein
MFEVTCPYCYHKTNRLFLQFVCAGWHEPGYPACAMEVDPRRREETGYEDPMYPVFAPRVKSLPTPRRARCPSCHGRTGTHACSECHTPRPADFGGSVSPVIALVGARSTGKTVYLTVVANQLRTVLRDRFRTNVWLHGDDARNSLDTNINAIFTAGNLPTFTQQPDGRSEPLVFEWRRRGGKVFHRYHSSYLSFLDTAGESLGTQRGVAEMRFLAGVNAFMVVLDPFTLPKALERLGLPDAAPRAAASALDVLKQVTESLRNTGGIRPQGRNKTPIAVAFAKIDAFRDYFGETHPIFGAEQETPWYDEAAGRAVHESVRELLREWGSSDIDEFMEANYTNYQYFAVSSLGRPPDYEQNTVAEGGVRPIRVAEPLVWLLSQYGIVPRRHSGGG